ncbi:MAG: hypothetical protein MJK14_27235, partial [Rivularia sp. ALOHA_DT_140]|nr:hypothetical protein [Rivularia sp. ALOHA_DT_140]
SNYKGSGKRKIMRNDCQHHETQMGIRLESWDIDPKWVLYINFGWEQSYIWKEDETLKSDLPNTSGIYVITHLSTDDFLYVGQAENLNKRVANKSHYKLVDIIEILENFGPASYDRSNVLNDMIIYYKEVDEKPFGDNKKRCLIWCESVTIGILKPAFQGNIQDIQMRLWSYGGESMNLKSIRKRKNRFND